MQCGRNRARPAAPAPRRACPVGRMISRLAPFFTATWIGVFAGDGAIGEGSDPRNGPAANAPGIARGGDDRLGDRPVRQHYAVAGDDIRS